MTGLLPDCYLTVTGLLPDLKLKVGSRELRLIKSILAGIERDGHGELWVREQFRQHTESVLIELQMGRLAPDMKERIKSLQDRRVTVV